MRAVSERKPPDLPVVWNRRFQTWKYEVGHRCLALRSPKPEYPTNIDVQFHNVGLMLLSPLYDSLTLREPTDAESETINRFGPEASESAQVVVIGADRNARLYLLRRGLVGRGERQGILGATFDFCVARQLATGAP